MALIERYFAVSASGSGDGSSVANAAALFDGSGNWSSVITGFDFSANGLRCRILPGAYTCAQSLAVAVTDPDPTAANPLILHGADADGDLLTPPDPNWNSCQPAFDTAAGWDSSDWPVIATTGNIATITLAHCFLRLLKFTATGRTGGGVITTSGGMDWVSVVTSSSNTSAAAATLGFGVIQNCVLACTGSTYSTVLGCAGGDCISNVRIVGGGSSGDCYGVKYAGTTAAAPFSRLTIVGNYGVGFGYTGTSIGVTVRLWRCVIAGNTGSGVLFPDTAAQTARSYIDSCIITGNGAYGIDPGGTNTNLVVTNCRLRDNTSGNFGTFGNYPTDLDNNVTDSDDASEYVDAANGDYRIKASATIWGKGYGVADEAQPTLPAAADVWYGTGTYGYASGLSTPAMRASDITVTNGDAATLTAPDIVSGVVVDDVTGSASGGGGVIVVEDD